MDERILSNFSDLLVQPAVFTPVYIEQAGTSLAIVNIEVYNGVTR